ncbi:type IX secretion system outer membrane channel protein PorV [Bacteroides nordii]|uniref:type IX secretion system outer membrane channel protein PorV n=1 Tax=Bacteroides nordii TaxID=291645 RepID=UPI001898D07A|nr:type IX secretion system outer membrane channel protein PorV [Bacteroides nordii]
MKKIFISFLLFFAFSVSSWAQKDLFNPINTGVNSLGIAPDSRGGGMGDVGAATDPDNNSQFWNPAKYPFTIGRAGVSISYTPWLRKLVNDIDLAYLAGYYRIGDYQAISGSLRYFSLGEVPMGGDATSGPTYNISPYEMAVDVAYSRMLSERFSAAVALRYIYSDLAYKQDEEVSPGSAFAADIAFYYTNYIMLAQRECMLSFGLNLSNIGTKISYDGGNSSQFLPTNFRLGGSLLAPIDDYNTIAFSLDINKLMVPTRPTFEQYKEKFGEDMTQAEYTQWLQTEGYNDISPIKGIFKSFSDAPGGFKEELQEIQWSLGVEYTYHNQFSVRGGYHYEHENKGNRKYFSFGAGFKMSVFSLDAAYLVSTAQSNPLDQTLRFTLGFDLDGIRDLFGRRR